ncbi:MAG: hypothetical protein ACTSUS_08185 [Candidatus Freyarchaeota archaeon]
MSRGFNSEMNFDFQAEAKRIVEEASNRNITLRIMGAVAARIHCPQFGYLQDKLKRKFTDLDFMTYKKHARKLEEFIQSMGYKPNELFNALHGSTRRIYWHNKIPTLHIDVFIDKLEMCHTIDFNGRLELDFPTLTVSDIILEKMQIVQINEKDVIDSIMLFREHELGEGDKETINVKYISKLLSDDWGFYYTFTSNLEKVKKYISSSKELSDVKKDVFSKIDKLKQHIENTPKSFKWKMRSKIGTKKKWYRDVHEV